MKFHSLYKKALQQTGKISKAIHESPFQKAQFWFAKENPSHSEKDQDQIFPLNFPNSQS